VYFLAEELHNCVLVGTLFNRVKGCNKKNSAILAALSKMEAVCMKSSFGSATVIPILRFLGFTQPPVVLGSMVHAPSITDSFIL
jgi:hypothetical protein